MDILAMIKLCISAVASAVLMPDRNIAFIVFLFVIYSQYKKNALLQEGIYGQAKTPIKDMMATAVLSGLIAGVGVSLPMTLLGISFSNDMGIALLIPISLFLMLIDPRFICFSYSGGLLAVICLIFGIKYIDVTGILELVAILHLLESILIYFDGHRGAVPVFYRKKDGTVVGGFSLQRMWPIPVAIIILAGFTAPSGDVIHTPDWWPLVRPYIDPSRIQQAFFEILPVTAVLGYSEFTSSSLPRERCRESSYKLAIFSLLLLLFSILSSYIYVFKFIAAVFAPAAHEYLIQYEKRAEDSRQSIFLPADDGVKVLDTLPGGPAEKMGIKPGETILSVNNRRVLSQEGLESFFSEYITYIWVDVRDRYGKVRTTEFKDYKEDIDGLGILAVPKNTEGFITVTSQEGLIVRLLRKYLKTGH